MTRRETTLHANFFLPLHLTYSQHFTLHCVWDKPTAHFIQYHFPAYMANPHQLPPGNTALGGLSAASSPLPMRSSTQAVDYPQAFTAEQLAFARSSLHLNPQDFPDFSQDTLSGLIPSETATLTFLSQLLRALVTIPQELSGVTQKLASLAEENDVLTEELHDLSSQIGNLPLHQTPPHHQDLSVLQSAFRNLSHRVRAQAPLLPQVPGPTPPPQLPARAPLTRKWKERARAPASLPPNPNEDPKYLIQYCDTKLGRAFGDPERYAELFPHSYEASELRRGAYDLSSFTPGHLHPDYTSSPSYAQAAAGSASRGRTKKTPMAPSPQQVASSAAPPVKKGPPSLPAAQRRFTAPTFSPVPGPDAPTIAATFPDIAARVLPESNCLLPFGFSASVNVGGAISLTVTDKATPAASDPTYFDSLTRALNQSFPVGEHPWPLFILTATPGQLAIHALPLRFLPQDEEELFPYLRQAILNDKVTPILSASYLNPSRDSRGTKQATSVVVTVDRQNVAALLQASSSAPRNARSNLPSQQAAPPSVETAGDTDTPISDAPPPTRRAPSVRFIILVRLTDVRIQPAPGAETISQSYLVG